MIVALVQDLLDLAKMQHGKFTLDKKYFDLSDLIYEACDTVMPNANLRSIPIKVSYENVFEERKKK